MRTLIVFYDARCGLCTRFKRWMEGEPARVAVVFVDFRSARAAQLCPDLAERGADREVVVMADDGRLWQGAEAWVTCLWALRRWRRWSQRLASPVLLPLARRMCHLVSANRLPLSALAGVKGDAVLAQEIADAEATAESAGSPGPAAATHRCEGGGECSSAQAGVQMATGDGGGPAEP